MNDYSFGIVPVQFVEPEPLYLLIRHNIGHWGFPKGHPEGDEDAIQAALRECREEAGLADLRILSRQPISECYAYRRSDTGRLIEKEVNYYLAEALSDAVTVQPEEIQDYAWLPYSQALERMQYPESKSVLTQAKERLKTLADA